MTFEDESEDQITYCTMNNKRYPYFITHGTEIRVNFVNLFVNADVITLLHLQPFIHVLLGRSTINSTLAEPAKKPIPEHSAASNSPQGLLLTLALKSVDLSLFRVYSDECHYERELENTYLIKAENLVAKISMEQLMQAHVDIEYFQIFDTRDASGDYVFRTIFCPLELNEDHTLSLPELRDERKPFIPRKEKRKLLTVAYQQELSDVAFVNVFLKEIVCLISLDVIMDLIYVSVSNAFAVLALLVAPSPPSMPHDPTSSSPALPGTGGTVNVIVNASDLTVVLLDDPTTVDSRAILSSVGRVEVHYHRDLHLSGLDRDFKESLHVSLKALQGSMLMSIHQWTPLQVLEPLSCCTSLFWMSRYSFQMMNVF